MFDDDEEGVKRRMVRLISRVDDLPVISDFGHRLVCIDLPNKNVGLDELGPENSNIFCGITEKRQKHFLTTNIYIRNLTSRRRNKFVEM